MISTRSMACKALPLALAGAMWLTAAPSASAQSSSVIRPPKVSEPSAGQTWLYYIVGIGLGAMAVGVTILPSRRTHQD